MEGPQLPEALIASAIVPFVRDRATFNNVALASHEMRRLITKSTEAHCCLPPWPRGAALDTRQSVSSLGVSCDRQFIAVGLMNGLIKVYSVAEDGSPHVLRGHTSRVQNVRFAESDRPRRENLDLFSASYDYTIRVWSMVDYNTRAVYTGHEWGVWSVDFYSIIPQNNTARSSNVDTVQPIVSASSDETIRLWEGASTSKILHQAESVIMSVAVSPMDNQTVAFGCQENDVQLLFPDGTIQALQGHIDYVNRIAFSADGRYLASASDDQNVGLWFMREKSNIIAAASDGGLDRAGSKKKTKIQNHPRCYKRIILQGHCESVQHVIFTPCSKYLLSCCDDGAILRWSIGDEGTVSGIACHLLNTDVIHTYLCLSHCGTNMFAVEDDDTIEIFEYESLDWESPGWESAVNVQPHYVEDT